MKQIRIPRVLIVNSQWSDLEHFFDKLESEGVKVEKDCEYDARVAIFSLNPHEYEFAVVDASDDKTINGNQTYTEWLKSQNPELIIIGASVQRELLLDGKGHYDKKICFRGNGFDKQLKKIFTQYGFLEEEVA